MTPLPVSAAGPEAGRREVDLWLTTHGDATRFVRVAELRALQQVGKEYTSKLQGLSQRIQMPEITDVRARLSETLKQMKETEADLVKRASKLWKSKLRSIDDLESLAAEVDAPAGAFEVCQSDLEDLQIMRRALRLYQKDYRQIDDDRLTWAEFEALTASLLLEAEADLGEEEIPWPPDEAIAAFVAIVTKTRKEASTAWIATLEADASDVATMSAADANRLHGRATDPPPVLTDSPTSTSPRVFGRAGVPR